jgi:lysyl-tRNA synthetase class 2
MTPVLGSVGELYREGIVDTGRETEFLFFVAFLLSFAFIRTSTHLIRAQVSWWPGNVSVGGTHIHHLVWGILLLLICGYIGVGIHPGDPWRGIVAVGFGIGTGLTLDEFALWLNLKDVYWSQQGRRSIDAVVVAAALSGMLLVGFRSWIDAATSVEDEVFALTGTIGILGIVLAVVNAAKEKFGMAILSILIPLAGLPSAFRLAKPRSVWARLLYAPGKRKRAEERFAGARGEPFWSRRGELLGRLRLGSGGAGGT